MDNVDAGRNKSPRAKAINAANLRQPSSGTGIGPPDLQSTTMRQLAGVLVIGTLRCPRIVAG